MHRGVLTGKASRLDPVNHYRVYRIAACIHKNKVDAGKLDIDVSGAHTTDG